MHQVGAGQELIGREDAIQILPLDTHEAGQTGSRTDKHGIESLAVEKVVDSHGAPYDHICLYFHSETAHILYLTGHDILLGETELGDAVDKHSPYLMKRLEDLHFIAETCQVGGAGQTGRT